MTALKGYTAEVSPPPLITAIAKNRPPQDDIVEISIAQMMGIDYVFLCSASDRSRDRETLRLASQVVEALELDPERTMFLAVRTDEQCIEDTFYRCQIRWVDSHPIDITREQLSSAPQIEYFQTILGHSSSFNTP